MRIALPAEIAPPVFTAHELTAPRIRLGGATMGTSWSATFAPPKGLDAARAEAAIETRLAGLIAELSQWEPDSLISRFNRAPAGESFVLPSDFAAVIETGLRIAEASGGAFDPVIGRLSGMWGFGPDPVTRAPTSEEIAAAGAESHWRRLVWDGKTLTQSGGLVLDVSGIGKGHAVDAVADTLAGLGARNALVEIGGELVGRGMRPDREPWWVDLEPPPGVELPPLRLALHNLAVATSGNYRRGEHSIDPRSGRPTAGVLSVSVIAARAIEADAWATALTILGPIDGLTLATEQKIAARLVVRTTAGVREILTPQLIAMLA